MNKFLKAGFAVFTAITIIAALAGCEQGTTAPELIPDDGLEGDLLQKVLAEAPIRSFDINNPPEPSQWNTWGEILNLPDPFQKADGSTINNFTQWTSVSDDPHAPEQTEAIDTRREEIKKIVQHYEYGYMPPPPDHMEFAIYSGNATSTNAWNWDSSTTGRISIKMWNGSSDANAVTMSVTYTVPSSAQAGSTVYGNGPYPAYTSNQPTWGWGQVNFPIGEASYDTNYIGKLFPNLTGGGTAEGWATFADAPSSLMCSAWGFSRVLDALDWAAEQAEAAGKTRYIHPQKTMVTGTSRGGKQALVVGAFAESQLGSKVAVVFPNASGSLGASMERFLSPVLNSKMDYYLKVYNNGTSFTTPFDTRAVVPETDEPYDKVYTLGKDGKGPGLDQGFQTQHHAWTDSGGYWPSPRNKQFKAFRTDLNIDKEGGRGYLGSIPYDQHFVMSLVAPRGLLITGGSLDYWNNPESVQLGYFAVREVYKFLNADKNLGFRWFDVNHSGASLKAAEVEEFAKAYFANKDPDTLRDTTAYPTTKYRMTDVYPIADPRSTVDYARMYWKSPNSSEKTIREQALEAAGITP